MGVLNVTPDSFSDGGRFLDPRAAVEHGLRLVDEGAKVVIADVADGDPRIVAGSADLKSSTLLSAFADRHPERRPAQRARPQRRRRQRRQEARPHLRPP